MPDVVAEVCSVTRKEAIGTTIAVPAKLVQAAEQAIEHHLKSETLFLIQYDTIYREIDGAFDVPNSDLSRLVLFCMDQKGRISNKRRKQYQYLVHEGVFEALEKAYKT